jgi:hypothetical protein
MYTYNNVNVVFEYVVFVSVSVIFEIIWLGHCQYLVSQSEKHGLCFCLLLDSEIQNQRLIISVSFCRRCLENKKEFWTEFSFQCICIYN